MPVIREAARETPVLAEVDVVVAGGGTAGVATAIVAARRGLKTIMVERTAQPGGILSHVTCWTNDFANKGGFTREFINRLADDGVYQEPFYNTFRVVRHLDALLADSGVKPLYMAFVVDVLKDGDTLQGVIVETKQGRAAILAKVVVDATGDADLAHRAGAACVMGRDGDGACQATTHTLLLLNAPEGPFSTRAFVDLVQRCAAKVDPAYVLPYDHCGARRLPGSATAMPLNMPHVIGHDWTTAAGVTEGLIELRQQAYRLFDVLARFTEGPFANVELGPFPALPGVRETRRIVGDYTITLEDTQQGARFADGLFTVTQPIDIHRRKPEDPAIFIKQIRPYNICLRALLPKGLDNLIVVGRCISGDHHALASYRIIANCMAMGEAAAITADMAVRAGTTLRHVPPSDVAVAMEGLGYQQ